MQLFFLDFLSPITFWIEGIFLPELRIRNLTFFFKKFFRFRITNPVIIGRERAELTYLSFFMSNHVFKSGSGSGMYIPKKFWIRHSGFFEG